MLNDVVGIFITEGNLPHFIGKKAENCGRTPHLQYFNTYYKNYRNANTFLNYYVTKTLKS